ncbi:MAG TPA: cell division protein FtsQ [Candidatus Pelagibacter bacterium]|nr:cell division protein FtsQ [Pelagibacteraceae bacterium]HJN84664.1 cell division protein FtsQ [Candidatus Pelagibacter bacterium]
MMHRSIDKKLRLFFYLVLFLLLSTQITKNNNVKNNIKNKLNNIEVIGLSEENNFRVYENLKFLLTESIFFINKKELQNILGKNNLIDYFYVKKIYPNLIKVKIKQTGILAITNQNNKKFYIGSNGKLIPVNQIKDLNNNLPFVYSKSNYINFVKLKKIIDKSEFKFEEIESFYYFPSKRWDIKTKDGFLIKLPEKNIAKSLKFAKLIIKSKKFEDKKIIDLRISKNIILSNE